MLFIYVNNLILQLYQKYTILNYFLDTYKIMLLFYSSETDTVILKLNRWCLKVIVVELNTLYIYMT